MRDDFFDVLAVRTSQSAQRYIPIPNPHLAAFPEQALYHLYLRAFSQVVGSGLEAQPQKRNLLLICPQHYVNRPVDMLRIAWQDRLQKRELQIELFGAMTHRP